MAGARPVRVLTGAPPARVAEWLVESVEASTTRWVNVADAVVFDVDRSQDVGDRTVVRDEDRVVTVVVQIGQRARLGCADRIVDTRGAPVNVEQVHTGAVRDGC